MREAGGGAVWLARITFRAAVFQSVTTSLSATEPKLKATLTTRFLQIGCIFICCGVARRSLMIGLSRSKILQSKGCFQVQKDGGAVERE